MANVSNVAIAYSQLEMHICIEQLGISNASDCLSTPKHMNAFPCHLVEHSKIVLNIFDHAKTNSKYTNRQKNDISYKCLQFSEEEKTNRHTQPRTKQKIYIVYGGFYRHQFRSIKRSAALFDQYKQILSLKLIYFRLYLKPF